MRKLLVMTVAALAFAGCCGKTGRQETQAAAEQTETKMIRLNVFVTVAPEYLDEVVASLNELAAASRAEKGCKGYDIFQNTVDPYSLIIVETWADDAALSAHQQTAHYTTILPPLADKMQLSLERFEF
jgi:quinol monooxygenase YgiN